MIVRPGALLALALLAVPSAASAQSESRAEGTVVRPAGGGAAPVEGARVTLHRVGRDAQGPVDSALTNAEGRFAFRFPPDTTAVYLLSARFAEIEYFSPPVHTNPARPDTAIEIVVADTSARAPVDVDSRSLVVSEPTSDASRSVLDMIVLRNAGEVTRVAGDSLAPTWAAALPAGAIDFHVGQGDFSPDALVRSGDSMLLYAPIAPGEKQLTIEYHLPGGERTVELPFTDSVATVNILVEESGTSVTGGTLALADSQTIEGRSFRRWSGGVARGDIVRILLPGTRGMAAWVLPALVGGVGIAIALAGWLALRRRAPAPVPPAALAPSDLLDAVAALDARYVGREHEVGAQAWAAYQLERARLKAALERSLADRTTPM